MHYTRWKRHGDPLAKKNVWATQRTPANSTLVEKILWRSDQPSELECWPWKGHLLKGYGRVFHEGQRLVSSRAAYMAFNGPIPEGLTVDHACHNLSDCKAGDECLHRRCVNPRHLALATREENAISGGGSFARKTHCPRGHPYEGENLVVEASTGRRRCRICSIETKRRHHLKKHPHRALLKPRLTEDQRREIYERWREGERQIPLAKEFGISQAQVSDICIKSGKETNPPLF